MKKVLAFLLAGIMAIGCLTACGGAKEATTSAPEVTTAAQMEVSEEFAEFLQSIYQAEPGTAGGTEKTAEAAKAFVEYAFANGEALTPGQITAATEEWLTVKNGENDAFSDMFTESFEAVCDEVLAMDEANETDVSILKFINGIQTAIDNVNGNTLDPEFVAFLDGIYAAEPGTAGGAEKTAEAVNVFKDYAFQTGEVISPAQVAYGTELYLEDKDDAYKANFEEAFQAVCEKALADDPDLETDVSFAKFMNGVADGIAAAK